MSPRWHRKSTPVWLKLVSGTTHVGTSATWLAQWCPLEMLCFLHSGVHRGHLARVLLRNLTNFIDLYRISLRGHCCTAFRRHYPSIHPSIHQSIQPPIHSSVPSCTLPLTIHQSITIQCMHRHCVAEPLLYIILWVAGGICLSKSLCNRNRGTH